MITVTTKVDIAESRIGDLLSSAFEGGSNYWYRIVDKKHPDNFDNSEKGYEKFSHISYPVNIGGSLTIEDMENDNKKYILNLKKIEKGLQLMAKNSPKHFQDFINENDDSETADVFLQYAVLGELVYG